MSNETPSSSSSPDNLSHEELARASFLYFLSYAFEKKPYTHINKIVNVLTSDEQEVAIVIPPGHGKSTVASQTFPSWYLGNHPDRSVLLISNTDKQAKLFLAANQETMEHNAHWSRIFPSVQPDTDRGWSSDGLFLRWKRHPDTGLALPNWRSKDATDKDPALAAFGIGGPVIGRRADVIIVDDPYSEEMARSETQRENFHNWFKTTLRSRLKPVPWAKMIVVVTRWHVHDIVAWMVEQNQEEERLLKGDALPVLLGQEERGQAVRELYNAGEDSPSSIPGGHRALGEQSSDDANPFRTGIL